MSYKETLSQHRRLAILKHLESVRTANVSILTDVCDAVGVRSTRDQVTSDVLWLGENGFVEHGGKGEVIVVTLLERGAEIASGKAVHPGIKRPRFGA